MITDRFSPLTVALDGERDYSIHFRSLRHLPGLLEDAGLHAGRCLLITDENVASHYRSPLRTTLEEAGWTPKVIVLPPGESTKSARHLHAIYDEALDWGLDRDTPVLALGGGVVGDLAGFAAATLLRGLPLVHLPTSLIAQVDSSIGGKTGINHDTGKNLIGAFYQPDMVVTDTHTVDTLPQREWTSGMAEVIKHALIADEELFHLLEDAITDVMLRRNDVHPEVIHRAARVKTHIVAEDEREQGRRAVLNFGHTFAHAIERVTGYGTLTHGEAVAVGMRANLHLSHRMHPDLDLDRTDHLVRAVPVQADLRDIPFDDLLTAMQSDKKARGGVLHFVLIDQVGHAYVTSEPTRSDLEQAWEFAIQEPGS